MDTKHLIANKIHDIVPNLEQEVVLKLLETPKNSDMGDLAFPAFSLAKILRQAPQKIASDIADKIDKTSFEKVEAVGPYINFFLDKSKYKCIMVLLYRSCVVCIGLEQARCYGRIRVVNALHSIFEDV